MNHKGTKRIETERLILRKFTEDDVLDMFKNWACDPEVTKFLTWPTHKSIDVTKRVINIWIEEYKNVDNYQWGIEYKKYGQVIGSISLMNIDNRIENCEVGYCLGKEFWNKGIITEAFSAIINFAFNEIGFQRITGRHAVDNFASGHVMVKCGMQFEGLLRKIIKDGSGVLVDCKYYSILRDEYCINKEPKENVVNA